MKICTTLKKGFAVVSAAALAVTGCLGMTGCGSQEAASPDSIAVEDTSSQEKTVEKAMGRYLEEDVSVPEGCRSISSMEFLEDGTLRVCYNGPEYVLMYADSKDQGKTWGEGISLYDAMKLNDEEYSLCFPRLAKDGGMLMGAYILSEEEDESGMPPMCYFYINPEGETKKLDLSEALGKGGFCFNSEFTEKGTVVMEVTGNGLAEINLSDGSIAAKYEEGESLAYFGMIGNRIITVSPDNIHYYDCETGKPLEDEAALTEQISSVPQNTEITGVGFFPAVFAKGDEKDSLFFADCNGMYRYSFGGSVVEKIIDGSLNRISSPDTQFVDLARDAEGCFYLAVQDYSGGEQDAGKILKYVYSKDTPAVPDTELTVYSLTENSYMRQVAAIFQKKYPNIYLNLETGLSGEDAMTSTDALKNLNTEIMAGKGPDVMILDGIPADTYIEKGMLEDLSKILDKMEKTDGILENIKGAYTQEDGSVYCMPLKFGIPMLQGDKTDIEAVTDLKALADVIEQHQEEYNARRLPMFQSEFPETILRSLALVCAPAWVKEDGTLDEAAVAEYIEQANRIYQAGKDAVKEWNGGEDIQYTSEYASMDYEISATALTLLHDFVVVSAGALYSSRGLAFVSTAERERPSLTSKLWSGQAEGCFLAKETVGISTKAAEKEAAEKFVEFLFSQEGQSLGTEQGFPVNRAVYESSAYWELGGNEDGVIAELSSSYADTGESYSLSVKKPDQETIRKVQELGKSLTVPSSVNEIILNAVMEAGSRYLKGETSLEEASGAAVREVNLYLSE